MQLKLNLSFILIFVFSLVQSQTTNINLIGSDESFRRNQLLGNGNHNVSNTIRPYDQSLYDTAFKKSSLQIDHYFAYNKK